MITVIVDIPGATTATYDELNRRVGVSETNVPDGLVVHTCAATDSGLLVTDVWESEEQFKTFAQRLGAASQGLVDRPIQPRILKTYNLFLGKVSAHR